jgi:hypothetical protein
MPKMSNPITRRTALAVPLTLPLLPVSALAIPADPIAAKVDNAISDFRRHFEKLPPEHRRTLAFVMRAAADTCHAYVTGDYASRRARS